MRAAKLASGPNAPIPVARLITLADPQCRINERSGEGRGHNGGLMLSRTPKTTEAHGIAGDAERRELRQARGRKAWGDGRITR